MDEVVVLQVPDTCTNEDLETLTENLGVDTLVLSREIETLSKGELTAMLENAVDALNDD